MQTIKALDKPKKQDIILRALTLLVGDSAGFACLACSHPRGALICHVFG
jgi:hypothetical protein